MDIKLEVMVLPVSDIDRAKSYYTGLGWRLDADLKFGDNRLVQVTPPGSQCSIVFGSGKAVASASSPGAALGYLIVSDIKNARAELMNRGVAVGEVFHLDERGQSAAGPDPDRRSYLSFASFSDPDGNRWLLQEITQRLPGRVDREGIFASQSDLADALRRAEAAHGKHEAMLGHRDENWPDWYADYLFREQSGEKSAA